MNLKRKREILKIQEELRVTMYRLEEIKEEEEESRENMPEIYKVLNGMNYLKKQVAI